jgi:hypothetical protein
MPLNELIPRLNGLKQLLRKLSASHGFFLNASSLESLTPRKKEGLTVITPEFMDKVRDKRSGEKDT